MDNNNEENQMNNEQEPAQTPQTNQETPQSQQADSQSQEVPSQPQQTVSQTQQETQQETPRGQQAAAQAQQFAKQMGSQVENFTKNKELLEKVGLVCACAGFIISFIFTIVSCSRSASNSISMKSFKSMSSLTDIAKFETFTGSYFFIVVLIGMIIAVAGGVMAFMSKRGDDFGMMAKLTFLVVIITLVFAIIPNVTICAYNNSLNNATEDMMKDIAKEYSSWY